MRSALRGELQNEDFCPKRMGCHSSTPTDLMKSYRLKNQSNRMENEAGREILDIFMCKNSYGDGVQISPPFMSSSPPARSANPLVHDARFIHGKSAVHNTCQNIFLNCSPVRASPTIRVEGFFSPSKSSDGFCPVASRLS